MPTIERDIVFEGKDKHGNPTIDLPITRLGNIEDTAAEKTDLVDGDLLAVVDSQADGEMKKVKWSKAKEKMAEAMGDDFAPKDHTHTGDDVKIGTGASQKTLTAVLSEMAEDISGLDDAKTLSGDTDPTEHTVGKPGQMYVNTDSGETFVCTGVTGGVYKWKSSGGGGGSGGGNVIKITFGAEFIGKEFTITDGASETKTGTVPATRVVNVSVIGCNTTYTIKGTVDGVEYTTTVTTGQFFGQYTAVLNVFTATINVTAVAGASVTATQGGLSYSAVAGSNGVAAVAVKKSGSYSISATKGGKTSTTASVNVTTDGATYTATVKFTVSVVPSQSTALTYTGGEQQPSWNNFDSNELTLGGTVKGTNAGSYSATFTPKAGYQWSDTTTTAKTVNWTIGKAAGSISINKTSLSVSGTSPTGQITVTRAGDGAISAVSSNNAVATASVSGNVVTVTGLADGSATITISVAEGTNHFAPSQTKTCSVTASNMVKIFGVQWDSSNSSTALSRLTKSNDPGGFVNTDITSEPSPAIGTGSGSSPFDAYLPWSGMEEYNIENGAVTTKQGQSGFSRTTKDTVVYIPEFYVKVVWDGTKTRFYIADKAVSGFTKHPGSGKYVGRYHAISGYYSKSGAKPLASITRSAARTGATGKGSKWSLYDFASYCAVNLLYLVEFADWNCQSKIGQGWNGSQSATQNCGQTDSMTYHTGTSGSSRTAAAACQYRHIEELWGNVRDFVDGANFNNRAAYICTDPSKYADDTSTNYTAAGVTLPNDGFIKNMGHSTAFPWAFIPSESGGSETTYIPDYAYSNTGWRILNVGGTYYITAGYCGLWYFFGNTTSSSSTGNLGARLLFHP